MPTDNALAVLTAAAQETLETMFFACPEPRTSPPEADPTRWSAKVEFHGAHHGRFVLILPESCARSMAANFKGVLDCDDVTEEEAQGVVCELANMVCGCALSRLAPDAEFDLDAPKIVNLPDGLFHSEVQSWFELEEGSVGAILELEAA